MDIAPEWLSAIDAALAENAEKLSALSEQERQMLMALMLKITTTMGQRGK